MIRDLDDTIKKLLEDKAPTDSELAVADISFEIPDDTWQKTLNTLTVNCYLYDIHENMDMRTYEEIIQREMRNSKLHAWRRKPPKRLDCAYCITAWSKANTDPVLEEHRVLSQVVEVLLKHPTIPNDVLTGDLVNQIRPYPTVIASQDGVKNKPEFWGALDQRFKPSLSYVITLAMMLDEEPVITGPAVETIEIETDYCEDNLDKCKA